MQHLERQPQAFRRAVFVVFYLATLCTLGLLIAGYLLKWHREIHNIEDRRAQVVLTAIALATGSWLIGFALDRAGTLRRTGWASVIFTLASLLAYLLLVWTSWRTHPLLWRVWWVVAVGTVTSIHVLALRSASIGVKTRRVSIACALLAAIAIVSLALRPNMLADFSPLHLWLILMPGAIGLLLSAILWLRVRAARPNVPVGRARRALRAATAAVGIFLIGVYLGRVTAPLPGVLDQVPSPLAELSSTKIDEQVTADLQRLRIISEGLDALASETASTHAALAERRQKEARNYYLPAEEDQARSAFISFLAYRSALLRMVANYGGFASVMDEDRRARCFLVGYAAGATLLDIGSDLVRTYRDDAVRHILNQPEPRWNLPAGMFDRVYEAITSDRNLKSYEEMFAYYQVHRDEWQKADVLGSGETSWLITRIDLATTDIANRGVDVRSAKFQRLVERIRQDAYEPVYATQSIVSTWVGDTRLVSRPPFISPRQVTELQAQLQPGDILLERRNWFLSNAFLPGFWPHAALYVGTAEDLASMGLIRRGADGEWTSDHPAIRDRIRAYLRPAHDGHLHTVLEAVSEGVIFNSLLESMSADYVAVLRPRLTREQKAQAIATAFSYEGKPYDFEFDFATSDKLVCTELVYRSYQGLLNFNLVRVAGRDTLPALEIVRKHASQRSTAAQELDFVLFLDTPPGHTEAQLADEQAFLSSADRPKGFNE